MQYWVMKTAREAGLKVMLDGQGGDETLLGYERYYIAFFLHLLKQGKPAEAVREFILAVRHSRMSLGWFAASLAYFSSAALRKTVMKHRVPFLREDCAERPTRSFRR
jgi:asparagine synthase (glutamine-hydrolysing)